LATLHPEHCPGVAWAQEYQPSCCEAHCLRAGHLLTRLEL
jgi:hypothetical protein